MAFSRSGWLAVPSLLLVLVVPAEGNWGNEVVEYNGGRVVSPTRCNLDGDSFTRDAEGATASSGSGAASAIDHSQTVWQPTVQQQGEWWSYVDTDAHYLGQIQYFQMNDAQGGIRQYAIINAVDPSDSIAGIRWCVTDNGNYDNVTGWCWENGGTVYGWVWTFNIYSPTSSTQWYVYCDTETVPGIGFNEIRFFAVTYDPDNSHFYVRRPYGLDRDPKLGDALYTAGESMWGWIPEYPWQTLTYAVQNTPSGSEGDPIWLHLDADSSASSDSCDLSGKWVSLDFTSLEYGCPEFSGPFTFDRGCSVQHYVFNGTGDNPADTAVYLNSWQAGLTDTMGFISTEFLHTWSAANVSANHTQGLHYEDCIFYDAPVAVRAMASDGSLQITFDHCTFRKLDTVLDLQTGSRNVSVTFKDCIIEECGSLVTSDVAAGAVAVQLINSDTYQTTAMVNRGAGVPTLEYTSVTADNPLFEYPYGHALAHECAVYANSPCTTASTSGGLIGAGPMSDLTFDYGSCVITDYYVSPYGSNISDTPWGRSDSYPWQTVNYAAAQIPGGTSSAYTAVHIADGVYAETVSCAADYVRWLGDTETYISYGDSASAYVKGIHLSGSYNQLRDLTVMNAYEGVSLTGNYNRLSRVQLINNGHYGLYLNGSAGNLVDGCTVRGNGTGGAYLTGNCGTTSYFCNNNFDQAQAVYNNSAYDYNFRRNWWNTTSPDGIASMLVDASSGDIVSDTWRLGPVPVNAGADSFAPNPPDTAACVGGGVNGAGDTIEWTCVQMSNEQNIAEVPDHYHVYRASDSVPADWAPFLVYEPWGPPYEDPASDLADWTTYYYRVTAVDAAGNESQYCDTVVTVERGWDGNGSAGQDLTHPAASRPATESCVGSCHVPEQAVDDVLNWQWRPDGGDSSWVSYHWDDSVAVTQMAVYTYEAGVTYFFQAKGSGEDWATATPMGMLRLNNCGGPYNLTWFTADINPGGAVYADWRIVSNNWWFDAGGWADLFEWECRGTNWNGRVCPWKFYVNGATGQDRPDTPWGRSPDYPWATVGYAAGYADKPGTELHIYAAPGGYQLAQPLDLGTSNCKVYGHSVNGDSPVVSDSGTAFLVGGPARFEGLRFAGGCGIRAQDIGADTMYVKECVFDSAVISLTNTTATRMGADLYDCAFYGQAGTESGAVRVESTSGDIQVTGRYLTFRENSAALHAAGSAGARSFSILDSIIAGNGVVLRSNSSGGSVSASFAYCDTYGNAASVGGSATPSFTWASTCSASDPQFIDQSGDSMAMCYIYDSSSCTRASGIGGLQGVQWALRGRAYTPPLYTGAPVVFNEVNYHPGAGVGQPAGEWVELYNTGVDTVDLQGWVLQDEGQSDFTIPFSVPIGPFGYVVLARDTSVTGLLHEGTHYSAFSGSAVLLCQVPGMILADGGQVLTLKDGTGAVVESITYSPSYGDGDSYTLARFDPLGNDWRRSGLLYGDPGWANAGSIDSSALEATGAAADGADTAEVVFSLVTPNYAPAPYHPVTIAVLSGNATFGSLTDTTDLQGQARFVCTSTTAGQVIVAGACVAEEWAAVTDTAVVNFYAAGGNSVYSGDTYISSISGVTTLVSSSEPCGWTDTWAITSLRWSADGAKLVYAAGDWSVPKSQTNRYVYALDADGGSPVAVSPLRTNPCPYGRAAIGDIDGGQPEAIYAGWVTSYGGAPFWGIFYAPLDGSAAAAAPEGYHISPERTNQNMWTPDFTATPVTNPSDGAYPFDLACSANGDILIWSGKWARENEYYSRAPGNNYMRRVLFGFVSGIYAAGHPRNPLGQTYAASYWVEPTWSPDGKHLALVRIDCRDLLDGGDTYAFQSEIWVLKNVADFVAGTADTTTPNLVRISPKTIDFAASDGQYGDATDASDTFYMNPAWSRDGKVLSYAVDRNANFNFQDYNYGVNAAYRNADYDVAMRYVGGLSFPGTDDGMGHEYDTYPEQYLAATDAQDILLGWSLAGPARLAGIQWDANSCKIVRMDLQSEAYVAENGGVLFDNGMVTAVVAAGDTLAAGTVIGVSDPAAASAASDTLIATGAAREFWPTGWRSATPVMVILHYDADDLAAAGLVDGDTGETSLKVWWYDAAAGAWQNYGGAVDPVANTLTFFTDHFSTYAIFLEAAPGNLSRIGASDTLALADGCDQVELKLMLKDDAGNPVPGVAARFSSDRPDTIIHSVNVTDALGELTAWVSSDAPGASHITCSLDALFPDSIAIEFVEPAPWEGWISSPDVPGFRLYVRANTFDTTVGIALTLPDGSATALLNEAAGRVGSALQLPGATAGSIHAWRASDGACLDTGLLRSATLRIAVGLENARRPAILRLDERDEDTDGITGEWLELPTDYDNAAGEATADLAHFSIYRVATAGVGVLSLNDIVIYPNPWRIDRHAEYGGVKLMLPVNREFEVKIYTINGELVDAERCSTAGGTDSVAYEWDLRNARGQECASGIYLWVIKDVDCGETTVKKVAVIR